MKIVIVIPTYNEKENIIMLVDSLQLVFSQMPHDMNILFVDDNSPDGTGDLIKKKAAEHKNICLLTGVKNGLGDAYIRGMEYAIGRLKADIVMEMDSDFSHNPEDIPRLVSGIEDGADFVIGSRYVRGGKIPDNWALLRKMNSRWGNIFARYIAGLYTVRDCTAGFRAIRASVIKKIDLSSLKVRGYAFQIALLHQAVSSGAAVEEIPVEFVDRLRGETKLGIPDVIEFLKNVFWIRFNSSRVFIKFLIVGLSGVFVNLGLFSLMLYLDISRFIASPAAIEASIISNFILNNLWTFRARNHKDAAAVKGLKFNLVSVLSLGISFSTFMFLSLLMPDTAPQIHQALSIVPAVLVNYFLNSYWTFRKN
jgi:dolichol-phosphate mannosyltransferase